jgi:hypothetical protein
MTHSLRCQCGKVKGTLKHNSEINRCVCYCADCQAFARFLRREREVLDARGGTSILQTIPANLTFTEGIEHLACLRLTTKGLLRWYTACCQTPIGNTPPAPNPSFIGLIHTCLSAEPTSLDQAFGPIRMYVNTRSARGAKKPAAAGLLSGTLRVLGMILKARLDGRYKQTPFFVREIGTPIVVPQVLNDEELRNVKKAT